MSKQTLLFGGDFTLGNNPEKYMEGVNDLLDSADFRMFQLEEPFLDKLVGDAPDDRLTKNLDPVLGKVDLVTLSGNHFYDFGEDGVRDTLNWCERNGIQHAGGGRNEAEARKPAFVEKGGVKIGVIAFCALGPTRQFARENRGGVAPLMFKRAYIPFSELDQMDAPRLEYDLWEVKHPKHIDEDCKAFNFIDVASYLQYAEEVYAAKQQCDILIAYLHKGFVHQPVIVDAYEKFLSHLAIDNGADVVIGTHSHIAHGIEMYKGKAIYHCLNNLVFYAPQLSPNFGKSAYGGNAEWVKKRVERFGFIPDPDYPTYPFHPDSVYCPVAKLIIEDKKISAYKMVLMKVEKNGVAYVHGHTETGQEVFDYMKKITEEAGLNAKFSWDGDDVLITE